MKKDSENVIAIGSVVRLKSGGPKMTMALKDMSGDYYNCIWFDGNKKECGLFPKDTLVIVNNLEKNK